ncbi:hypothetical protein D3C85_1075890 [compost metagenome]
MAERGVWFQAELGALHDGAEQRFRGALHQLRRGAHGAQGDLQHPVGADVLGQHVQQHALLAFEELLDAADAGLGGGQLGGALQVLQVDGFVGHGCGLSF